MSHVGYDFSAAATADGSQYKTNTIPNGQMLQNKCGYKRQLKYFHQLVSTYLGFFFLKIIYSINKIDIIQLRLN
jgi:hypothetical protein